MVRRVMIVGHMRKFATRMDRNYHTKLQYVSQALPAAYHKQSAIRSSADGNGTSREATLQVSSFSLDGPNGASACATLVDECRRLGFQTGDVLFHMVSPGEVDLPHVRAVAAALPSVVRVLDVEDVTTDALAALIQRCAFQVVTYRYQCPRFQRLRTLVPSTVRFVQWPHHVDTSLYRLADADDEKTIDVLLYGNLAPDVYPMRARLHRVINNRTLMGDAVRIVHIPHPGYPAATCPPSAVVGADLAQTLRRTWLVIATRSERHYLLKRYLEAPLCGAVLVGDLPTCDPALTIGTDDIVHVTDDMSDADIASRIVAALGDKTALRAKARRLHDRLLPQQGFAMATRHLADILLDVSTSADNE